MKIVFFFLLYSLDFTLRRRCRRRRHQRLLLIIIGFSVFVSQSFAFHFTIPPLKMVF